MKDKISTEELNKMAEIDGEVPFDSKSPASSIVDENFVKAMEFTNSLKSEMSVGVADAEIPDNWIEMINDADLSFEKKIVESKNESGTELIPKIVEFFNPSRIIGEVVASLNPTYALGGVFACVLAVGLFFQTGTLNNTNMATQSNVIAGDYFYYLEPVVRGSSSSSGSEGQTTGQVVYDSIGKESEYLLSVDYEPFASIFLAMDLDQKSVGNLKGETWELWASFLTKNADECIEIFISKALDDEAPGVFLNYCPKKWSKKVSFLKVQ